MRSFKKMGRSLLLFILERFVTFADGKDQKVHFHLERMIKELPPKFSSFSPEEIQDILRKYI